MGISRDGDYIKLDHNGKVFRVSGADILKWLADVTESYISLHRIEDINEKAPITREEKRQSYGSTVIPREREVNINSMGDFVALQALWVKGIFSDTNVKVTFPRWKCSFVIYKTQHSPHSTDLVVTSVKTSIPSASYANAVNNVRYNIQNYWDYDQIGQVEMAKEIRQMLKGKESTQAAEKWDMTFMELAAKVLSFMLAAEATRFHVMLPIGVMANDLIKFGELDYGSYGGLSLNTHHYNWKGKIVPYFWECVKEAVGLRSAAEYLETGGVSGTNDLNKAKNVVSAMIDIVAAYLDSYLRLGKGANTKFNLDIISDDEGLMDVIQDIIAQKVLSINLS